MEVKHRDITADLLKGFAIVLLVMSHVLQFSAAETGISYVQAGCSGIVELWARSFNMPLFFFVSGLLIGLKPTPQTWHGTGKAILHKMRTLLLPGVTFMLFRRVVSHTWYMDWFLIVLFEIIVVFLIVRIIVTKRSISLRWELIIHSLIFAIWVGISFYWKGDMASLICFHRAATAYPYLVMGYLFRMQNGRDYMIRHNWVVSVAMILYVVAFYLASYILSGRIAIYLNAYIAAPAAIIVCYQVANALKDKQSRIITALKYCGEHSISIYLIHMFFMVYCTAASLYINNVPASFSILLQIVFGIAGAIPIIAICLAIEYVIMQSKFLNLICFGKSSLR